MISKALVIDDDQDVRKTISFVLEGLCEVIEAENGEDALRLLASERPRVVLLDVSMPGMGGLDVLPRIRASDPGVPIIMLTSADDIETAKKSLDMGASMYMTKPYDVATLRKEVGRLLDLKPADARPWKLG
ncbi:MAG: response regulator [Elusimicrobiota bacterium]